jgi:penicillin-binding protein 1A
VYQTLKEDYGFDSLVDREVTENGSVITDKAISPMALGQLTKGVSLRTLSEAYTAFPGYGNKVKTRSYLYVTDKDGEVILENDISYKRVFSSDTGKIMNQLLSEVVKSGTARAVSLSDNIAVAGKTGTSGNNKDKIFIGYTPTLVSGIWCGYNDGKSISGISPGHLEIWDRIMTEIEDVCMFDQGKSFETDGLMYAPYCMDSGKKYSQNCIYDPRGCRMEYGYFKPGDTSFSEKCDTHIVVSYDTENKGIAITRDENKEYAKVSLIKNTERSFPKEVYITDAEYVYRDIDPRRLLPNESLPYFYGELKSGEYVGISNKKRQFNRLAISKEKEE